jgi:hypothetical protein
MIGDLGIHHVEGFVLRSGYTAERVHHDYGIDLVMTTYDTNGEVQNGEVLMQVKATESLPLLKKTPALTWPVSRADLARWLGEPMPVILVIYGVVQDRAYWLYIQRYFAGGRVFRLARAAATINVRIPTVNLLNETAVRPPRLVPKHQFGNETRGDLGSDLPWKRRLVSPTSE